MTIGKPITRKEALAISLETIEKAERERKEVGMIDDKIEKVWENFWKEIVCRPDGEIDIDQLKLELFDYYVIFSEVSKVYDELTGSRISKPNTYAYEVISRANEYMEELWEEERKERDQEIQQLENEILALQEKIKNASNM